MWGQKTWFQTSCVFFLSWGSRAIYLAPLSLNFLSYTNPEHLIGWLWSKQTLTEWCSWTWEVKFSSTQNILSCPASSALFHLIPHPPSPPHPPSVGGPHLIDLGQGLAAPERAVYDLGCGFIEYQVSRASLGHSVGKESACSAGDLGLIPRLGRSPGEGKGHPEEFLQSWGCRVRHDWATFTLIQYQWI